MRGLRPSLTRRLLAAFTIGPALAILAALIMLRPMMLDLADANAGPQLVMTLTAAELGEDSGGRLVLPRDARVSQILQRSPQAWVVVKRGAERIARGTVPPGIEAFATSLPLPVKQADFGDMLSDVRTRDVSIARMESAAGPVTIIAGGIAPNAIELMDWLVFAHHDAEFYMGLTLIVLICLAGGPLAIPIILASIRPTSRAAARLDLTDSSTRLPERSVIKELLPVVRAFNAALDRLAEAFDRRRRFIADVAHELRTPLAVLGMHVDGLPDSMQKADLQRLVFRLGQMIGQMLDAERLALVHRQRESFDLVALVREASAEIAPLAVANGYELAFESSRRSLVMRGDPHAISRAISNLLGNAVAHGGGRGTIEVRVGADGAIAVADEGPGIAVEARERIFEPFHRERWDRDGCGLGLYLVREIMRAHGGEAVAGTVGRGATLELKFPASVLERWQV